MAERAADVADVADERHGATDTGGAAVRPRGLARLFEPVDVAALVFFRVTFGAILIWEVWRYFHNDWIGSYYVFPDYHFTYYGFDWVRPWPGDGMYVHFAALSVLAGFVMVGFLYRLSALLLCVAFTYVFLLDQARYLNHFYFVSLVSLLAVFVPAHRALSVDAWLRPSLRAATAPAWTLWILRAQMGFVYFFGGVAKLNGDWLAGQPMQMWLARRTDYPVLGPWFDEPATALLFSWGGLSLDLLLVPCLLWRRTRAVAFVAAVSFHLLNDWLFRIGIFPWFSIAMTALFFAPGWPRRWFWFLPWPLPGHAAHAAHAAPATPGLRPAQRVAVAALSIHVAVQVLLPLRHLAYPGNVSWNEEGHCFAWHMKLRDKQSDLTFFATAKDVDEPFEVDWDGYLTARQERKMSTRPDMILQFSHFLAGELRADGYADVAVRALVSTSLNGRAPQLLVDPAVDLASQPRLFLAPYPWVLPLRTAPPD